jgi:hypothetical protein
VVPAEEDPARGRDREPFASAGGHGDALQVDHRADDPTRKTEDLLLGSRELIHQSDRVPRRLIWDNAPGIEARNIVLLGPRGAGKLPRGNALGVIAVRHEHTASCSPPRLTGAPASATLTARAGSRRNSAGCADTG